MQKPYAGSPTVQREREVRAPLNATNDVPPEWLEQWRRDEESPYQSATPADIAWRFGRELFRKGQTEPDTALGRIGREMTKGAERNSSPVGISRGSPETAERPQERVRAETLTRPIAAKSEGITKSLGFNPSVSSGASRVSVPPATAAIRPNEENSALDSSDTDEIKTGHLADRSPTEGHASQSPTFQGEQAQRSSRLFVSSADAVPGVLTSSPPLRTQGSDHANVPVVNREKDRIEAILNDKPAIFEIEDNHPRSEGPFWALHGVGVRAVEEHDQIITEEAERIGLDPDLLRAVVYVENARGILRDVAGMLGERAKEAGLTPPDFLPQGLVRRSWERIVEGRRSFLPGNVREDIWGGAFGVSEDLSENARANLRITAHILKSIEARLRKPTVAAVASIYNFTGAEQVNDYGALVERAYQDRTWTEVWRPEAPFMPLDDAP